MYLQIVRRIHHIRRMRTRSVADNILSSFLIDLVSRISNRTQKIWAYSTIRKSYKWSRHRDHSFRFSGSACLSTSVYAATTMYPSWQASRIPDHIVLGWETKDRSGCPLLIDCRISRRGIKEVNERQPFCSSFSREKRRAISDFFAVVAGLERRILISRQITWTGSSINMYLYVWHPSIANLNGICSSWKRNYLSTKTARWQWPRSARIEIAEYNTMCMNWRRINESLSYVLGVLRVKRVNSSPPSSIS